MTIYNAATRAAPPKRAAAPIAPVWYAAPPVEVETLLTVAPELSVVVLVTGVPALLLADEAELALELRDEEPAEAFEEIELATEEAVEPVAVAAELASLEIELDTEGASEEILDATEAVDEAPPTAVEAALATEEASLAASEVAELMIELREVSWPCDVVSIEENCEASERMVSVPGW
jgi:hypothetical protein